MKIKCMAKALSLKKKNQQQQVCLIVLWEWIVSQKTIEQKNQNMVSINAPNKQEACKPPS